MFRKNPNLQYQAFSPYRISDSRMASTPHLLLGGKGEAALLGGFGEASVLLDFDREIVGGLEVTLICKTKAHIRIDYEEEEELAKRREPLACNWYQMVTDEYDLDAGEHTIISQGRRGFRYVNISTVSKEDVTLCEVIAHAGTWKLQEKGSFRCSDDRLNRIWDISASTVKACMQDFYEDGVKRDGLLWLGDYRVTFLSAYYLTGDVSLARKSLLMIRDSQYECGAIPACAARGGGEQHHRDDGISYMPRIPGDGQNKWIILNYMCDYIRGIEEYVRMTGDDSILPEVMESAEKAAKYLLTLIDLETPGVWYIDDYKAKRDENGFNYTILMDCGINPLSSFESKGAFLFQYLSSMNALEKLGERTSNIELIKWAQETGARIEAHIEEHYKDPMRGQYLDQKKQKFAGISQYVAPHVILAGKKDPIGMERMMRSVMPNLGFSMSWRIEAMFREGYAHEALRDIASAWGKMVDADSRTCWERLDAPEMNATHYYDALGSFCHGWSAGPAWQLPAWVVGIKPSAAGFKSVEIIPNLDLLDYAEATVPTPSGTITARVERKKNDYTLFVSLPKDVEICTVKFENGFCKSIFGSGKFVVSSQESNSIIKDK